MIDIWENEGGYIPPLNNTKETTEMGWSQDLTGSSAITDEEVEEILDEIDASHWMEGWSRSRQHWGWSTECDISRRDNILVFSGAHFTFKADLPERFEAAARERGHTVLLGPRTG